jgi:hypothetical protein
MWLKVGPVQGNVTVGLCAALKVAARLLPCCNGKALSLFGFRKVVGAHNGGVGVFAEVFMMVLQFS